MLSTRGECTGKILSTPTPNEILRTVKVSLMPLPLRPMTTPSKACRRSLSPSTTLTFTRTVSPDLKDGTLVLRLCLIWLMFITLTSSENHFFVCFFVFRAVFAAGLSAVFTAFFLTLLFTAAFFA